MLTGTIAEDPVIEKYFKLILMQLIVQQVFVDNLLDVSSFQKDSFELIIDEMDPQDEIRKVVEIF